MNSGPSAALPSCPSRPGSGHLWGGSSRTLANTALAERGGDANEAVGVAIDGAMDGTP